MTEFSLIFILGAFIISAAGLSIVFYQLQAPLLIMGTTPLRREIFERVLHRLRLVGFFGLALLPMKAAEQFYDLSPDLRSPGDILAHMSDVTYPAIFILAAIGIAGMFRAMMSRLFAARRKTPPGLSAILIAYAILAICSPILSFQLMGLL